MIESLSAWDPDERQEKNFFMEFTEAHAHRLYMCEDQDFSIRSSTLTSLSSG